MRSAMYEQALDKEGVKWSYVEKVPLTEINESRSLRTQARIGNPVDEHLVADYAQMIRQGLEAPALLTYLPKGGKHVVIDGIQRLFAKKECRCKFTDLYIVETTDQEILDRICWTWNNRVNGKRLSPDECLQHAITFVKVYGWSQKRASEEWGVPESWIRDALAVERTREALDRQKVKVPDSVPDSVVHDLQPLIRTGEDVLAAAAKVTFESGLPRSETVELVNRVLRAKTHDDKLKAVEEFGASEIVARRRAESKGGRVRITNPSPKDRLLRWLAEGDKLVGEFPQLRPLLPGSSTTEYKTGRKQSLAVTSALIAAFGLGALPREEAV